MDEQQEEMREWSKWTRGADGRFTRFRASSGVFPPLSMADQRDMYQTLNSAYLNALEARLKAAEAKAALADEARELIDCVMAITCQELRAKHGKDFPDCAGCTWLARYDALSEPG